MDYIFKYQYGNNVWEERFIGVANDPSDVVAIAYPYNAGIMQYTFGLACNTGVSLQGNVIIEEYLNGVYRTQRAPSFTTSTNGGVTYNFYGSGVADANPIPLIEGVTLELQSPEYVLDSFAMNDALETYFNPVLDVIMDVDAYSTGNTANTTILTALWDNIQNLPADMYPASYQVRISAYVAAGHMSEVAYVPYTAKQFQVSFMNFIGYMTESEQDDAIINERVFMALELGHNDGERFVVDAPYKFRLGIDGDIQNETDPDTGGNVDVHVHIPPTANDNYNPDTSELTPQAPGQAMSVDNLLYTSYILDDTALTAFGQYIWANDLVQTLYANQTSPVENILSCKRIPFTIGGADTSIKIGNIDTEIGTTSLAGHVKKSASGHVKDCGTITVPVYNGGNWLDMTNKYSIYLPYCGIQSLPTDALLKQTIGADGVPKVTGRTLGVKYYYDIIYGTVIAEVSVDGNAMFIFNGECGIDIPITASNRASNQLAMLKGGANTMLSGVSNVVGGVISGAMSGGLIGAAVGGLMGVGNTAMNVAKEEVNRQTYELHYTTSGGFNSQVASYLTPTITLYCEHVLYTEPAGYAKENGYPCYLNRNMSELTGYTELDGSIEISGIPCLEEERDLLKQALMDGFYL